MPTLRLTAIIVVAAGLAACRLPQSSRAAPPAAPRCFGLAYVPDSVRHYFPSHLVLAPGNDSATAVWGADEPDSLGAWLPAQATGVWIRRSRDSLLVVFSNRLPRVRLALRQMQDRVGGRAVSFGNAPDTIPQQSARVEGLRLACSTLWRA